MAVHSYYQAFSGMKVAARVLNLDMTEKYARQATFDVPADGVVRAFEIPELTGLSTTYFLPLDLEDAKGRPVSSNFYWLSTTPDLLDWEKSTWYHTATKFFADLKALADLPEVELKLDATTEVKGSRALTRVRIENPGRTLAFMVRLRAMRSARSAADPEILPILWRDAYFSLLPGERRETSASWRVSDAGKGPISVSVDGWNVIPRSCAAGKL